MKVHFMSGKEVQVFHRLRHDGIDVASAVREACHLSEDATDITLEADERLLSAGDVVFYQILPSDEEDRKRWQKIADYLQPFVGKEIVLLPDPEEGFDEEEHVILEDIELRHGILLVRGPVFHGILDAVDSPDDNLFEVDIEQAKIPQEGTDGK